MVPDLVLKYENDYKKINYNIIISHSLSNLNSYTNYLNIFVCK